MVSVVIVNWNTPGLTAEAVASVLAESLDEPVEVIVVDNASSDDSVTCLRERFPSIRLIAVPENVGFARGNNLGLRRARGEWTLLLNSDAALEPGALGELLGVARARPRAGLLQPMIVGADGSIQCYWGYVPGLLRELWLVLVHARRVRGRRWQAWAAGLREPLPTPAIGLPALLVPMWVWRRIGLLDSSTFLFFEESDLSDRARAAGLEILLVPAARVRHHGGMSTGRVPATRRRAHYESRMWFYRTHRDPISAGIIRWLSALRAVVGIILAGRRGDAVARDELWRPVLRAAGGGGRR